MLQRYPYIIAFENELLTEERFRSVMNDEMMVRRLFELGYLDFNNKGQVSFRYVGAITLNEKIICVLPKYYINSNLGFEALLSDFVQILKVLKRTCVLDSSIPDSSSFVSYGEDKVSRLVLAENILSDFVENGIFQKSTLTFHIGQEGETNWVETINNIDPIIVKNTPVYDRVVTQTSSIQNYNLITDLHKWIVKDLFKYYGRILDYSIILIEDSVSDLSELGSEPYLMAVVQNELNATYTDREIKVLRQILHFLDSRETSSDKLFDIYGTGFFHVLWEKACGFVLENSINNYKHLIPSPQWLSLGGESASKDSLIPDITAQDQGLSIFFIFDAKYYNIRYDFHPQYLVSGNPGVNDVSKQFLYQFIFRDLDFSKKYNCFIFPRIQETTFEVFGRVAFPPFPESYIYNIYLSPKFIFEAFINNRTIKLPLIKDIALAIDRVESI